MGYKNREIEVKLQVMNDLLMTEILDIIGIFSEELGLDSTLMKGNASDLYWPPPANSIGDFVRLRVRDNNEGQITLKAQDKGSKIDRVEIDLDVDYKQGYELMYAMFGEPQSKVTKKYVVFFLQDEHTSISVYKVNTDNRIFIEVEAKSLEEVKDITKLMIDRTKLELSVVDKSIYDMFVLNKEPNLTPVTEWLK